jgi:phosphopantothenoylcysteine decarboxylase/phosphopantothenate--cysteine ligase
MNIVGKRILLGMTGGVACYKAAELARLLVKAQASVQVIMTQSATRFIGEPTMQAVSGKPVFTDQWDSKIANGMAHIELSRESDAILIAPCSANFASKLAHGACDDLLSTLCLARPAQLPLIVAPAMNVEMWTNPAAQRNFAQLRSDGIHIAGPDAGIQACGETGMGRMLEPESLIEELLAAFAPKSLAGKRVVITAGPTFEPIDPVRGITNLSSGKMGYAIARAARRAGADVTLVSGPTSLQTPFGVHRVDVQTALQMRDAVISQIAGCDLFIAVAAVADWRPQTSSASKIKKQENKAHQLEFTQNPDILAEVAALGDGPYCVGFAAESENLLAYAEEKRKRKGVPLLVGNIGPDTFGRDRNELVLFDADGHMHLPLDTKDALASQLISEIARRMSPRARG